MGWLAIAVMLLGGVLQAIAVLHGRARLGWAGWTAWGLLTTLAVVAAFAVQEQWWPMMRPLGWLNASFALLNTWLYGGWSG